MNEQAGTPVARRIVTGLEGVPRENVYIIDDSPEGNVAVDELRRECARADKAMSRRSFGILLPVPTLLVAAAAFTSHLSASIIAATGALAAVIGLGTLFSHLDLRALDRARQQFESAPGVALVPGMDWSDPVPKFLSGADPAQVLHAAVGSRDHGVIRAVIDRMYDEFEQEQGRETAEERAETESLVDSLVSEASLIGRTTEELQGREGQA